MKLILVALSLVMSSIEMHFYTLRGPLNKSGCFVSRLPHTLHHAIVCFTVVSSGHSVLFLALSVS